MMARLALAVTVLIFPILSAFAQATQFYLEDAVGPGLKVRIYLIAQPQAKEEVQRTLYATVDHARNALTKINQGLQALNRQKSEGTFMIDADLAKALHAGAALSEKTNGEFDVTRAGLYKKVKVDVKDKEIKIKANGVQFNLDYILKGFLGDLMAEDLAAAGWTNTLIKVGEVYVTRGNDVNAPWRIPVVVPGENIAKRVLYYQATGEAAAGATWVPAAEAASDLKSVTIFAKSGAESQGLANTISHLGFEKGKQFLARNKSISAILVDTQGNLTNLP